MELDDAVLAFEEELIAAGRAEGRQFGLEKAQREARDAGVKKGYELGLEFGFYVGIVARLKALVHRAEEKRAWEEAVREDCGIAQRQAELLNVAAKLDKQNVVDVVDQLDRMIQEFPRGSAFTEEVHAKFLKIRAKFRVLESRLGTVFDIQPSVRNTDGSGTSDQKFQQGADLF